MSVGKLGRRPRKFNSRTLLFPRYSTSVVAPPPEKVYYEYLVRSWPMYLNDSLGDCVFACGGHMLENWSAHAEGEISPADSDILAAYEAVGGYNPSDPSTDNGAAITDFLAWWQKNPLAGKQILAWAAIDPTDQTKIKQAIWLFGGIDIGFNVPQSAVDEFNTGQNWEVPSANSPIVGGHSVCVFGYGSQGCACITWGKIQYMSWEFFFAYCDEAYALVTQDWITTQGKSPSGLDLDALNADLAALGS